MKSSIAITLIITIGIFGFVGGYSIGFKNGGNEGVGTQASISSSMDATASPGYGAPAAPTGGYGAPTGGYGK
jgi:hypothetical protein